MLNFLGYDNYNTLFKDAVKLIAVVSITALFWYMILPSYTRGDVFQDNKEILIEIGITSKENTN